MINQNGVIRNKGMEKCLLAHKKKSILVLSECPIDKDNVDAKYVFVYNEYHKTIIATVSKKFGAITYSGETGEYLTTGDIDRKQWTYKRV